MIVLDAWMTSRQLTGIATTPSFCDLSRVFSHLLSFSRLIVKTFVLSSSIEDLSWIAPSEEFAETCIVELPEDEELVRSTTSEVATGVAGLGFGFSGAGDDATGEGLGAWSVGLSSNWTLFLVLEK